MIVIVLFFIIFSSEGRKYLNETFTVNTFIIFFSLSPLSITMITNYDNYDDNVAKVCINLYL